MLLRRIPLRALSRTRGVRINGEGIKLEEVFSQREDMSLILDDMQYGDTVTGVLEVLDKLDTAVEKTILSDKEGETLLSKQLDSIELHLSEGDFSAAKKSLQITRQLYKRLQETHNGNVLCLSLMIKACCMCQETDLAELYLAKSKELGYQLEVSCLNNFLNVTKYASMGMKFADFLQEHNTTPNEETFKFILMTSRDTGDLRSGVLAYEAAKKQGVRSHQLTELMMQLMLSSWCSHSNYQKMKETLTYMRSAKINIRPTHDFPSVLSVLIQQCKAEPSSIPECVSMANLLWGDVIESGEVPPLVVCHNMLRIHVLAADPEAAEGVITVLKQNDIDITDTMKERVQEAHTARDNLKKDQPEPDQS